MCDTSGGYYSLNRNLFYNCEGMGLKFLQINAGKRINAANLLEVFMKKEDIDIVLIQETYRSNKGKLKV